VNRLVQRRRETGEWGRGHRRSLRSKRSPVKRIGCAPWVDAQPDRTLAELREALHSSASLSSVWRALDRLQLTVKKNGTRRQTTPSRRRG
jgi:hypothetical protein